MTYLKFCWLFLLALHTSDGYAKHVRPSYRVTVVEKQKASESTEGCAGIILQKRVVLTTASCFGKISDPMRFVVVLMPHDEIDKQKEFSVIDINVNEQFNASSLENNLAVLKINESLPLESSADSANNLQWIIIEDGTQGNNNDNCNAFFSLRHDIMPNHIREAWKIFEILKCQISKEIFSLAPHGTFDFSKFDCIPLDAVNLPIESEGIAVVCDSKLFAVTSILHLSVGDIYSTEVDVFLGDKEVSYTLVSPHLEWIYGLIAEEEYTDIIKGNYTTSLPFQELEAMDYEVEEEKDGDEPESFTIKELENIILSTSTEIVATEADPYMEPYSLKNTAKPRGQQAGAANQFYTLFFLAICFI